jgi:hypothetical protein
VTPGRLCRALACIGAVAVAVGCGDDLAFEQDERLRFLAPPEGARVTLPVLVRWSVAPGGFRAIGFDGSASDRRGVFAVFVDSPPLRPGRHLDSLAAGDRTCETSPGCPDATWLADHGVYLVKRPALLLRGLPRAGGRAAPGGRRHDVTVVLLDGRGFRSGDAAWTRSFVAPEAPGR